MGFKFQKRIKVLPGVTLNLSKSGITTSLGVTGARVTYGRGKKRTTVGLPGSGISHTTIERQVKAPAPSTPGARPVWPFVLLGLVALVAVAIAFS